LIKKNYIFHEKLLCELLVGGSGRGGEEGAVEEEDENEELITKFRGSLLKGGREEGWKIANNMCLDRKGENVHPAFPRTEPTIHVVARTASRGARRDKGESLPGRPAEYLVCGWLTWSASRLSSWVGLPGAS
jgi:hypothetical protein